MRIISTSYINTPEYTDPIGWLERIGFHTGILIQLAKLHEVISIEQVNYSGKLEREGVVHYFLNFKKKKLNFPFALHRFIKKLKPDIVLVHGLIFPLQLMQLRWVVGKRATIIMQHHAEKPYKGWKKIIQQKTDDFVSAYLFTSREMGLEWVANGLIKNEKKIVEVMEGSSTFSIMDKETALKITKAQGSPVYLWVGRLNDNKDPLNVIKAFLSFAQNQPQIRLYMIYHTEELLPAIKNSAEKSGLKDVLFFVGKVSHTDLQAWYNSADFIISGSHYEGSGIAVCEAMSCGCIPILTDIPSFRKMTGNGTCGYLYKPGDSEGLLKLLLQTATMDIKTERQKTIEQFENELSFGAIAQKIYQTILNIRQNA